MLYFISESNDPKTGGGVATKSNFIRIKKKYSNQRIKLISLKVNSSNSFLKIINFIFNISNFDEILKIEKKSIIWIDRSFYGLIILYIKIFKKPKKINVFYHNNEVEYFKELKKINNSFKLLLKIQLIKINESLTKLCSDEFYYINPTQFYNSRKSNKHLYLPLFERDKHKFEKVFNYKNYYLIVGSNFPPNIHGMNWLIDFIIPYVPNKNFIFVGRNIKNVIESHKSENIFVLSDVENLSPFYDNCIATICPIFFGSGLKIKICESIYYGKKSITNYKNSEPFKYILKEDYDEFIINYSTDKDLIEILNSKIDNKKISSEFFKKSNLSLAIQNK